jgi:hypothetical protein
MLAWLIRRLFHGGVRSKRGTISLGEVGQLARAGPVVWILIQEKTRLEYLAAKEEYERFRTRRAYKQLTERFLQLQSTNAIITSLINEYQLERLSVPAVKPSPSTEPLEARRSA